MQVRLEICKTPLPGNEFLGQWFQRLIITVDGRIEFDVFITARCEEEVVNKAKEIVRLVEWQALKSVH